jgi:hypothetical protein
VEEQTVLIKFDNIHLQLMYQFSVLYNEKCIINEDFFFYRIQLVPDQIFNEVREVLAEQVIPQVIYFSQPQLVFE